LKSNENLPLSNEGCNHSQLSQNNLHPIEEEFSVKKKNPKLSQSNFTEEIDNTYSKIDYYQQYPIEYRTVMWEQNRRKKIEQCQHLKKNNELNDCTFQPIMASNSNDYMKGGQQIDGKVNISSIDKFLSRMYSARIERENRKIEQANT